MLKEAEMVKLLGRPLTTTETQNYNLYLKIATERLEELLCISLSTKSGERTYETRKGYRTVYVDTFSDIFSVKIDGEEVETYVTKQNDNLNGSWYNIIEFETKRRGENITVDATWGFKSCPHDLELLLAKLFDQGSVEQNTSDVKSKKIEDFSVTYNDRATFDTFVSANSATIQKYSQCDQGVIRHGRVRDFRYY